LPDIAAAKSSKIAIGCTTPSELSDFNRVENLDMLWRRMGESFVLWRKMKRRRFRHWGRRRMVFRWNIGALCKSGPDTNNLKCLY
jgi:hypothetical protein